MKKPRTSLRSALLGIPKEEGRAELRSDIETVFDTLSGFNLVDAVIARVQRYAVAALGKDVDSDFGEMTSEDTDNVQEIIRKELQLYISSFISNEHREFLVRAHANGNSTSLAVTELIVAIKNDDSVGARRRDGI